MEASTIFWPDWDSEASALACAWAICKDWTLEMVVDFVRAASTQLMLENQEAILRHNYGDPYLGGCAESIRGGSHVRIWHQISTYVSSPGC